jgi:hypothetical protein
VNVNSLQILNRRCSVGPLITEYLSGLGDKIPVSKFFKPVASSHEFLAATLAASILYLMYDLALLLCRDWCLDTVGTGILYFLLFLFSELIFLFGYFVYLPLSVGNMAAMKVGLKVLCYLPTCLNSVPLKLMCVAGNIYFRCYL